MLKHVTSVAPGRGHWPDVHTHRGWCADGVLTVRRYNDTYFFRVIKGCVTVTRKTCRGRCTCAAEDSLGSVCRSRRSLASHVCVPTVVWPLCLAAMWRALLGSTGARAWYLGLTWSAIAARLPPQVCQRVWFVRQPKPPGAVSPPFPLPPRNTS